MESGFRPDDPTGHEEGGVNRTGILLLGLAPTVAAVTAAPTNGSAGERRPALSCATAEFRQFDFFVGDWDTYNVDESSTLVARNRVTVILGGCVVHERYEQVDGLVGESYSIYDASRGVWHQSWVTNRGGLLLLEGGLDGGRMILTATEKAADGASSLLRGIWHSESTGVRETAERSTDGGKTWKPVFDLRFRLHGQGDGP